MLTSSRTGSFLHIAMIAAALALASIFLANNALGAGSCTASSFAIGEPGD